MKITKKLILFFLSYQLSSFPLVASETVSEVTSNLQDFNYPSHSCGSKPTKPVKVHKLVKHSDVDAYNIAVAKYNVEVAIYNKGIKEYKNCINSYIKNGNADIEAIRHQLNTALKEARD